MKPQVSRCIFVLLSVEVREIEKFDPWRFQSNSIPEDKRICFGDNAMINMPFLKPSCDKQR